MKPKRSESVPKSPAQADLLVKGLFDAKAGEPAPEHLVELADELDYASRNGRLKRPGQAA